MTKGEGEEWAQAAVMGAAIDPNNPLYGSANGDAPRDTSTVLAAPTQPLDEQGLATLLANTQADTGGLDADSPLDADTSYFSNTKPAATDASAQTPETLPELEPEAPAPVAKVTSNDLDFDLDGMDLPDMQVPNTIPRPTPVETPAEIASIDFNFLDEPLTPPAQQASEVTDTGLDMPAPAAQANEIDFAIPELSLPDMSTQSAAVGTEAPLQAEEVRIPEIKDMEFSLKDDAPLAEPEIPAIAELNTPLDAPFDNSALSIEIPGLEDASAAQTKHDEPSAVNPLDFDLSGISLDLNSAGDKSDNLADFGLADIGALGDASASAVAEMATKLDLAIAYQEIGDKEGARELLDEVLKGGTPEQSERAKSLLLELA